MFEYEDFDVDYDVFRGDRLAHRRAAPVAQRRPRRRPAEFAGALGDALEPAAAREFSYQASRHEAAWISQALGPFFAQGLVSDVLRLAKGGKEASVYVCAANPGLGVPHLAAKIYRPRQFRNLRNDAVYRTGRQALDGDGKLVKDSRALHAMQKGTGKGKAMSHTSWLAHELRTMQLLHAAGADVPRPYGSGDNVILMTYVGDARAVAPTLNHVSLRPREAGPLFERVMANVDLMLGRRRVHGDLSAYNILYWRGAITLIDFPQAVDPYENAAARALFERDVARVVDYFAGYGVEEDPAALAEAIWRRHIPDDLWELVPPVEDEM